MCLSYAEADTLATIERVEVMEEMYEWHIAIVKKLIGSIWIGDVVSLRKLYWQLDFDTERLNELRGLA